MSAPVTALTAPGIPGAAPVVALPNNGGNQPAAPASTPSQALLVTSNAARTATANNVTKLNQITMPPAQTTTSPDLKDSKTSSTLSPSPAVDTNYMLKAGEDINTYNARVASYNASKNPAPGADGQAKGTPVPDQGTGGDSSAATGDPYDAALSGISKTDPGLAAQFKQGLQSLDTSAQNAYSTIQTLQTATAATDPTTQAVVAGIKAKYDLQIQLMKQKNAQVIGRANTSVAAFGGLGTMSQEFLSNEQADADRRVSTLQSQEDELVLKAQMAFSTANAKALDAAMKQYDDVNAKKMKALSDLLSASNKQVTQMQNQQKIDAAAQKQAVSLDISKSTNLGAGIAKSISDAGITDPDQIAQYIQSVADEYGISNPDILSSAVEKARQAAAKTDATLANSESTIQSRATRDKIAVQKANGGGGSSTKGSGTDGGYKYTGADVDSYKKLLAEGGTGPDGTKYAPQGDDTYSDPNAYLAALKDWTDNKGTAAGFAKKFPPKTYVNPESYQLLPKAIQPKVPAAASTTYTTK